MNEDDLEVWRLSTRVLLLEKVLTAFLRTVAETSPNPRQTLENWESQVRAIVGQMTFPTHEPVQSDMLAAEAQACVDHFLSLLIPKQ